MCVYCEEDRDGYVMPLCKNVWTQGVSPNEDGMTLNISRGRYDIKQVTIHYCPMCGRCLDMNKVDKKMEERQEKKQ